MTASLWLFLAVLGLIAVVRLVELELSRRRRRGRRVEPERGYGLMVILHVSLFALAPLEVVVLDRPFVPALFAASFLVLVVAEVVRVRVWKVLGDNWNVRVVEPARIVTDGPYRFVRHPNYAVVIVELLALPLLHSAWGTALLLTAVNALVLYRRIACEERMLDSLPGYSEAMGHKPRFIPRVFR